jgi:hypothetical protein
MFPFQLPQPVCRLARRLALGVSLAFAAGAVLGGQPANAAFTGYYALPNWTQFVPATAFIDFSGDPEFVALLGSSDNSSNFSSTELYIVAPPNSLGVSFDWVYETFDTFGPGYDPFGYFVNTTFFQLSQDFGPFFQGGQVALPLAPGDLFGFAQVSLDGLDSPAVSVVYNFQGYVAAPGPLPLLGVGAAFAWSRGLRKRIGARKVLHPGEALRP